MVNKFRKTKIFVLTIFSLVVFIGVAGVIKAQQTLESIPNFDETELTAVKPETVDSSVTVEIIESPIGLVDVEENTVTEIEVIQEEEIIVEKIEGQQVFLVYSVGSQDLTSEEAAEIGVSLGNRGNDGLADVVSVIVNTNGNVVSIRIPRDLYSVAYGRKVSEIPNIYNVGALIDVAETYTGLKIDYSASIDFKAFVDIIDELGGIQIFLEHGIRAGNFVLEPGTHILDGETVLEYSRIRKGEHKVDGIWVPLDGSDTLRIERQRDIMEQVFRQVNPANILSNLGDYETIIQNNVTITDNFNLDDLSRWVQVETFQTYQITGQPAYIDSKSVVIENPEDSREDIQNFLASI